MEKPPADPREILTQTFGFPSFRGPQEAVIRHTLAGGHSLVLMPTGMGKSLCYQIPARILSGTTLVISPLIALMKDQVDAAVARGFSCCFINSSLSREEREKRYRGLARGRFELVYVTPERFQKTEFREALSRVKVPLLAVDEAHCISQWGHDFRPDYTRIAEFREFLGGPATMALTATATPDVREDIVRQMGLGSDEVRGFFHGMERDNLDLRSHPVVGLERKLGRFLEIRERETGPTIVYFSLVETLRKFSEALHRRGIPHGTYHGQLGPRERRQSQQRFMSGENPLMLATPAFGLGVDKSDVRLVVHGELPGSIEAYYQEVGRAGRDGLPARGELLYDEDDISIQMEFLKWANPEPAFISTVYHLVAENPDRVNAEGYEFLRNRMNFYNSRDFRVETAINLLQRWDCLEGEVERRNVRAVEPPPRRYLDEASFRERLKSQQKKLLEMVRLAKQTGDLKPHVYRYFGLTD